MSNDKMREEFEAWARKMSMDLEYRNIPGVGQFYECPRTLLALEAWQASREALVIELPRDVTNVTCKDFESGRDAVVEAIEAAGVKVK